jgi:hypothetical protein
MAVATKKKSASSKAYQLDKTLIAALTAVERAGKEITHLAREGKKRVKAHEAKVVGPARAPKKVRTA